MTDMQFALLVILGVVVIATLAASFLWAKVVLSVISVFVVLVVGYYSWKEKQ